MFRNTLLLPDSLEMWPQHVVGAALISCPPRSTWAQTCRTLASNSWTACEQHCSARSSCANSSVLQGRSCSPSQLLALQFCWFPWLGCSVPVRWLLNWFNSLTEKKNHLHVTLSPLAGRRAWGDLEANSLYFAIRCCNTCGYCMLHSVARVPWTELIEFGL